MCMRESAINARMNMYTYSRESAYKRTYAQEHAYSYESAYKRTYAHENAYS